DLRQQYLRPAVELLHSPPAFCSEPEARLGPKCPNCPTPRLSASAGSSLIFTARWIGAKASAPPDRGASPIRRSNVSTGTRSNGVIQALLWVGCRQLLWLIQPRKDAATPAQAITRGKHAKPSHRQ